MSGELASGPMDSSGLWPQRNGRHGRGGGMLPGAALGALVALVVSACGGGGGAASSAPPVPEKVSGQVVMTEPSDNPGDIALRRQLAEAFMKTHPGVTVKILIVPATSYDQKVQTMIAGGKPPDIFGSGDVQIPNIVSKNFALDLMPYVKRDSYDLGAFYPEVVKGLTYDRKLVGLTDNWDTQVMYYNASLFEKAGLAPPTKDWTWDDFTSAAQKLTSGSGTSKIYGAVYDNWFAPYFDQMWMWGADPYPDKGTKCGYDSQQSIAAFDSIVDLYKSGVSPTPSQFADQGAEQLFLSGRVGMMIGSGRWAAYDMRDVKRFLWKVTPVPMGPEGRANFFHLAMFAIARTSKNPEAAWEFLKYMVSEQGIQEGLAAMQGIPSRKAMADSSSFQNDPFVVRHDAVQPFLDSLPDAHTAPYLPNWNQIQDQVDAALDSVWSLKQPPSQVLPQICSKIEPELGAGGGVPGGG
jgi:multiple sugar transport system substrate-binding protein